MARNTAQTAVAACQDPARAQQAQALLQAANAQLRQRLAATLAKRLDAVLATQIPGENDGKVSVERAKVGGMRDFLVLPVTHTFIVNNDVVIGQTLHFLKHGNFLHEVAH